MRWRDGAGHDRYARVVGSEDPENANCRLILRVDIAAILHLCLLMSIIQFAYCLLCGICTRGATITDYSQLFGALYLLNGSSEQIETFCYL